MLNEAILKDCESLLYVGAGHRTNAHFGLISQLDKITHRVALDIDPHKLDSWRFSGWLIVCQDATNLEEIFDEPKMFDAIVAIDFIEHLTTEDAGKYLRSVDNLCKKVSVIITPEGFLDTTKLQAEHVHSDLDVHKSGWSIEDFASYGYDASLVPGFVHRFPDGEAFNVICAVKRF